MKKILLIYTILSTYIATSYAEPAGGILGKIDRTDVREGRIHLNDIPNIIKEAIDLLMGLAGTIAIVFIIIGAYQVIFGALHQDKTKGRDTIIMALSGFVIAALAWFILKFIIDNIG